MMLWYGFTAISTGTAIHQDLSYRLFCAIGEVTRGLPAGGGQAPAILLLFTLEGQVAQVRERRLGGWPTLVLELSSPNSGKEVAPPFAVFKGWESRLPASQRFDALSSSSLPPAARSPAGCPISHALFAREVGGTSSNESLPWIGLLLLPLPNAGQHIIDLGARQLHPKRRHILLALGDDFLQLGICLLLYFFRMQVQCAHLLAQGSLRMPIAAMAQHAIGFVNRRPLSALRFALPESGPGQAEQGNSGKTQIASHGLERFHGPPSTNRCFYHATKVMLTKPVEYRIPIFIVTKRIRTQIARGSAELAILSILQEQPLYGFEISRQIDERTNGALHFTLASLYPMLYDLEKRGLIAGRWQSNEAGRDRRYYSLTPAGKKQLAPLREEWRGFFRALDQLAGVTRA